MGARTTFAREDEERPSVELNVREEVRRGSPYLNGKWRCFLSFPFAFSLQEQRSANSGAGRLPPPGPAAPPKRRRQVSPPSLSLTRPNHALFPVGEKPQQKRKAHASWRDKAWRAPRAEKERFRLEGLGLFVYFKLSWKVLLRAWICLAVWLCLEHRGWGVVGEQLGRMWCQLLKGTKGLRMEQSQLLPWEGRW